MNERARLRQAIHDALRLPVPRGSLGWIRPGPVEATFEIAGGDLAAALIETRHLAEAERAIRPQAVLAMAMLAAAIGGEAVVEVSGVLLGHAEGDDPEVAAAAIEALATIASDDADVRDRLTARAERLLGRATTGARAALAWLDPLEALTWLSELAGQAVPVPAEVVAAVDAVMAHGQTADRDTVLVLDRALAATGDRAAAAARRRIAALLEAVP